MIERVLEINKELKADGKKLLTYRKTKPQHLSLSNGNY